jgi:hypothetical protein
MAGKSALSIRAAVTTGFERCASSQTPLCCLAEFLDQLLGLGWDAADVRLVESQLLDLLGQAKERALQRQENSDAA